VSVMCFFESGSDRHSCTARVARGIDNQFPAYFWIWIYGAAVVIGAAMLAACFSLHRSDPPRVCRPYCFLASRLITVASCVPSGNAAEVKTARISLISLSNDMLNVSARISAPEAKIRTLPVPVQSELTV
jgi:hypothetical protein